MTIQDIRNSVFNDANNALKLKQKDDSTLKDKLLFRRLMKDPRAQDIYTYGLTNGLLDAALRNSKAVQDILNDINFRKYNIPTPEFKPRNHFIKQEQAKQYITDEARPQVINRSEDPIMFQKPKYYRQSKLVNRLNILNKNIQ